MKYPSKVSSSSLNYSSRCISSLAEIAQLGERQTEDLKVPGSNPEGSREP